MMNYIKKVSEKIPVPSYYTESDRKSFVKIMRQYSRKKHSKSLPPSSRESMLFDEVHG